MIWIGTSGWSYRHWVGPFYAPGLAVRAQLAYYAQHFPTVEINSSFYYLPTREQFAHWAAQTAARSPFLFAVKASRYLTHVKRLHEAGPALARLLEAAAGLGERLGPILYQLPPRWPADLTRLASFVRLLPPGQRAAFEFRHPSWLEAAHMTHLARILAEASCTLVVAVGGPLPTPPALPAVGAFRYLRFHSGRTGPAFTEEELQFWAEQLRKEAAAGRDCYVYFNNDISCYAVANARRLRELLLAQAADLVVP